MSGYVLQILLKKIGVLTCQCSVYIASLHLLHNLSSLIFTMRALLWKMGVISDIDEGCFHLVVPVQRQSSLILLVIPALDLQ